MIHYLLAKNGANFRHLGAVPSTFAISTLHTILEEQPLSQYILLAKWSTIGKEKRRPATICTSLRIKDWKRFKPSIAIRVSIPGECCTVDHIDHRFNIAPQLLPTLLIKLLNPTLLLTTREIDGFYPRMRLLIHVTANEPSNAASKNGASPPNIILPTETPTLQ